MDLNWLLLFSLVVTSLSREGLSFSSKTVHLVHCLLSAAFSPESLMEVGRVYLWFYVWFIQPIQVFSLLIPISWEQSRQRWGIGWSVLPRGQKKLKMLSFLCQEYMFPCPFLKALKNASWGFLDCLRLFIFIFIFIYNFYFCIYL